MIAFSRFRVADAAASGFEARAEAAASFFRTRPGCVSAEVLRNLDDPDLWGLLSRWENVGSYRRALQGYESKMVVVPLLSEALDEPSAYVWFAFAGALSQPVRSAVLAPLSSK